MTAVERFYHFRVREKGFLYTEPLKNGGVTVRVTGDTEKPLVNIQLSWCCPKDVFGKKEGRRRCTGFEEEKHYYRKNEATGEVEKLTELVVFPPAKSETIALRQLPGFLGRVYEELYRRNGIKLSPLRERPHFDRRVLDFLPQ